MFTFYIRSATGENWHNIMLACSSGAKCDQSLSTVKYDRNGEEFCGSSLAHVYFISFIFVCSWLVRLMFLFVLIFFKQYIIIEYLIFI